MINKNLLFLSIIITIFAQLLSAKASAVVIEHKDVEHKTLKIQLSQDSQDNLSVEYVNLEDGYPLDYRLNLYSNYYIADVQDDQENIIYSGKFPNKRIVMFSAIEGMRPPAPIVERLDRTFLYLPYFNEAEKVLIKDEDNNLKLEINLADYILTKTVNKEVLGNETVDWKNLLYNLFTKLLKMTR